MKWPDNKDIWISAKFESINLNLKVKEIYNQSGSYLKISGKYNFSDTLFEYVLYTRPFSQGPLKKVKPIRKVTTNINQTIISEDYYSLHNKTDSLFNDPQTFFMSPSEYKILQVFDSILKEKKEKYLYYQNKYQNILDYPKYSFAENDNGMFFQTKD